MPKTRSNPRPQRYRTQPPPKHSRKPHPHIPSTTPATAASGKPRIAQEGHPCRGMPPLSPGKGGLQSIPASQATSGAVEGSSPSPGTSKGSIPRPFQRPNLSIRSGDIEAAGYPLKAGPKFGTWPLPIKEGQGLSLQIEAEDAFGHPKGKIW
ncbi:hypothetical protein PAXRUDRAFT_22519 [Paxillus rubicundulus Ve08.2h10]|uniref:Uncharacterized protein n=1 Tax=Paxillus rubicundulus Ve08.2h10 TaxID=930991 RepID=A0A0D0D5A5_9AGAM|nr:hypothetical protein PAXRUDRAFT_22519 [Paxillus rubicundulus Ve08.2h10]